MEAQEERLGALEEELEVLRSEAPFKPGEEDTEEEGASFQVGGRCALTTTSRISGNRPGSVVATRVWSCSGSMWTAVRVA
ncbi:MAG: hypothetical protein ABEJ96_07055, partial [Thiohalorhabdaceae bacterium]